MCEKCEKLDVMVEEINEGKRQVDREMLDALLVQVEHVLTEMREDIASDKPWVELLTDVGGTMFGMSLSLQHNAQTIVGRALIIERARIAQSN